MPGKRAHSGAWDRCVKDVKRRGNAVSPFAVCTASLKEMSFRKGKKKNPLSETQRQILLRHIQEHAQISKIKPYYIVSATKGGKTTYLTPENRFSTKEKAAWRFSSTKPAVARARSMLHLFPHLKTYQINIRAGF